MPVNKMGSYSKVNDTYISFIQQNEREPTEEELAEQLGITTREVSNLIRGNNRHASLDAPINGEESDGTLLDLMSNNEVESMPDFDLINLSLKEEISEGLSILAQREAEVIESYFGLNGQKALTLEEIGEKCNLTRERVRQIKERAIRRLRRAHNMHQLKSYLG